MIKIIPIALIGLCMSCGSGERVVMKEGAVYKVKNDNFYSNGKDVTELLSKNEKEDIKATLKKRLEAERIAEDKKEKLEKEQKKVEEIIKKAKKKQEALEESQKKIEEKQEAIEDARDDFLKAKEKLASKQEKYNKLKEKGKLSPSDEEKWQGRFEDLEAKIKEYNTIYKNLK
ncbi:hypothetical protein [Algibacter sp. Ld11]|uniref:hypothetical protein n=1 Tax=Algibacter sp. Ld11 TaxID=649150 RepID=UPI00386B1FDF